MIGVVVEVFDTGNALVEYVAPDGHAKRELCKVVVRPKVGDRVRFTLGKRIAVGAREYLRRTH